jgi:hypothetical protein
LVNYKHNPVREKIATTTTTTLIPAAFTAESRYGIYKNLRITLNPYVITAKLMTWLQKFKVEKEEFL